MSGSFREVETVAEVTNPGKVTNAQGISGYSCRSNLVKKKTENVYFFNAGLTP